MSCLSQIPKVVYRYFHFFAALAQLQKAERVIDSNGGLTHKV